MVGSFYRKERNPPDKKMKHYYAKTQLLINAHTGQTTMQLHAFPNQQERDAWVAKPNPNYKRFSVPSKGIKKALAGLASISNGQYFTIPQIKEMLKERLSFYVEHESGPSA